MKLKELVKLTEEETNKQYLFDAGFMFSTADNNDSKYVSIDDINDTLHTLVNKTSFKSLKHVARVWEMAVEEDCYFNFICDSDDLEIIENIGIALVTLIFGAHAEISEEDAFVEKTDIESIINKATDRSLDGIVRDGVVEAVLEQCSQVSNQSSIALANQLISLGHGSPELDEVISAIKKSLNAGGLGKIGSSK